MNKLETFILVAGIDESQESKKEFDGEGKIWHCGTHQDYNDLLVYMIHLNHVIYQKKQNLMEIIMVVVVKPEMDRHKVKSFKKLKKKLGLKNWGI